jgi:exodeoxyribonuclease VII large subunit
VIDGIEKDLRSNLRQFLQKTSSRLDNLEKVIKLLDPANVLKRGYSITHHNGKLLKDVFLLRQGDIIETSLFKGVIKSVVESAKEVKEREQEQTNDLFSGIDRT